MPVTGCVRTIGCFTPGAFDGSVTSSNSGRFEPSELLKSHGVVSGLSVLIHGHPKPFGVVAVHGRLRRSFTPDDVHFLQALANVVAAAIERDSAQSELDEHRRHLETLVARRTAELEQSHERLDAGLVFTSITDE